MRTCQLVIHKDKDYQGFIYPWQIKGVDPKTLSDTVRLWRSCGAAAVKRVHFSAVDEFVWLCNGHLDMLGL